MPQTSQLSGSGRNDNGKENGNYRDYIGDMLGYIGVI